MTHVLANQEREELYEATLEAIADAKDIAAAESDQD
jgi:hypothetical protein